ncbi:hypothetical protein PUN28_002821 [Cardiocondyla obscurior]|uniref:Uncharacterized protein n=1 Tax=Cardiocondyla obscurior TaxID=286306 RepID=A0AAW2GW93_9HYME
MYNHVCGKNFRRGIKTVFKWKQKTSIEKASVWSNVATKWKFKKDIRYRIINEQY